MSKFKVYDFKPKFLIIGLLPLLVAAVFALATPVSASPNHNLSIDHRFSVSDGEMGVRHIVSVTNRGSAALDELDFMLPLENPGALEVKYSNGNEIDYEVSTSRSKISGVYLTHSVLSLDFPRAISGNNQSWQFEISYTTDSYPKGVEDNYTLILPFLDAGVDADWKARVSVPGSWPAINYRPEVRNAEVSSSVARFRFDSRDYDEDVLALSFAQGAKYKVNYVQELKNSSIIPRFISINLSLDTHSQISLLESLEPKGSRVSIDEDGNITVSYWMWPFQTKSISYTAVVSASQLRYNAEESLTIAETPDELATLVRGGRYWTTQGETGQRATGLINPEDSAWDNMQAILEFVIDEIDYVEDFDGRVSADDVLEGREGDNQAIVDLLVTMLRSVGVPSRSIYGVAYPSHGLSSDNGPYMHIWAESYIAGIGWVNIDPIGHKLFNNRGYSSSNLIGLVAVSNDQQQDLAGNLVVPGELVLAEDDLEQSDPIDSLDVSLRQYVVLPGVLLNIDKVSSMSNSVIDGLGIDDRDLGSIAPNQDISIRYWSFGMGGERGARVSIGDDELTAQATTHWWPLIALGVIIAVVTVLQFIRRRRNMYLKKRLNDKVLH